ncbi:MAG: hypothetical protein L3K03_04300 [Thermoplasmata archaeon]|nr:hypothetical protein [Thermoplasmata archaeon]
MAVLELNESNDSTTTPLSIQIAPPSAALPDFPLSPFAPFLPPVPAPPLVPAAPVPSAPDVPLFPTTPSAPAAPEFPAAPLDPVVEPDSSVMPVMLRCPPSTRNSWVAPPPSHPTE